jgi:hypothetical protein
MDEQIAKILPEGFELEDLLPEPGTPCPGTGTEFRRYDTAANMLVFQCVCGAEIFVPLLGEGRSGHGCRHFGKKMFFSFQAFRGGVRFNLEAPELTEQLLANRIQRKLARREG